MIVNNFTHPVIEADNRDPAESWRNHIARGSAGGVDLAYPLHTALKSCAEGVWGYKEGRGTGGNIGTIYLPNGDRIEFLHLASSAAAVGRGVNIGDVVAFTGNSGTPARGGVYPAHLHVHYVTKSGVRVSLWGKFTPPASTPNTRYGIGKTNAATTGVPDSTFYKRLQLCGKLYGGYTGALDGKLGVWSWKAVQRIMAKSYGYWGAIDGHPDNYTYAAIQRWAARWGYTGRIDGVPGPNTWRAIARALNTL